MTRAEQALKEAVMTAIESAVEADLKPERIEEIIKSLVSAEPIEQVQYSTEEQLRVLRSIYNEVKEQPTTVAGLIRLANFSGLYDAADHILRESQSGPTTGDAGLYMISLMEW